MKRSRQLDLFEGTTHGKVPHHFGGSLLKGNAKTKRPLSTKEPLHLVMKSRFAMGQRSMLPKHNAERIDRILRHQAKACGVRIYHLVNVGNHLHLVVRIQSAKLFMRFIRSVTGLIARHMMKAERGRGRKFLKLAGKTEKKVKSFWEARPFTRLISWGKDYKYVANYMEKNRRQARHSFVAWGFDVLDETAIRYLNTA